MAWAWWRGKKARSRQRALLDKLVLMNTGGELADFSALMREEAAGAPRLAKHPGVEYCTKLMERLYSLLGVLDAKANGLLRVNSMFITLISLLGLLRVQSAPACPPVGAWPIALGVLTLVMLVVSSILCMLVVRVDWTFYAHVAPSGRENPHRAFENEIVKLAVVVDFRTISYQWAWMLALAGLPVMVVAGGLARPWW